jgi:hypothetical protein
MHELRGCRGIGLAGLEGRDQPERGGRLDELPTIDLPLVELLGGDLRAVLQKHFGGVHVPSSSR